MPDLFEIARIGLGNLQQRLDATARNAANATVPGYRRSLAVQSVTFTKVAGGLSLQQVSREQSLQARSVTDLTAGPKKKTGNPADVAIDTPNAFFLVSDGNGQFVTRAGNFRVGADGVLLTGSGRRVQGADGDVVVSPGTLSVAEDGVVSIDGKGVGRIQLVKPLYPERLNFGEGGVEAPATDFEPVAQSATVLRQGYLEEANTNQSADMVSLMTTVRQYESLIRASQAYDDMLSKAIQKLGDTQY